MKYPSTKGGIIHNKSIDSLVEMRFKQFTKKSLKDERIMLSHTELHLPKADENILNVYGMYAIPMIREKTDIVVTKQNTQIRSYSEVKNGVRLQEFL